MCVKTVVIYAAYDIDTILLVQIWDYKRFETTTFWNSSVLAQ